MKPARIRIFSPQKFFTNEKIGLKTSPDSQWLYIGSGPWKICRLKIGEKELEMFSEPCNSPTKAISSMYFTPDQKFLIAIDNRMKFKKFSIAEKIVVLES